MTMCIINPSRLDLSYESLIKTNFMQFWRALSVTGYVDCRNAENYFQVAMTQRALDLLGNTSLSFKLSLMNSVMAQPGKTINQMDIQTVLQSFQHLCATPVFWLNANNDILRSDVHNALGIAPIKNLLGIVTSAKQFADQKHPLLDASICIEPVMTLVQLRQWVDVIARTYDFSDPERELFFCLYEKTVTDSMLSQQFTHYLACDNDQAIAASTVFYGSFTAGLYNRVALPGSIKTEPRVATYHMPAREFADISARGYELISSDTDPRILQACEHLGFVAHESFLLYQ